MCHVCLSCAYDMFYMFLIHKPKIASEIAAINTFPYFYCIAKHISLCNLIYGNSPTLNMNVNGISLICPRALRNTLIDVCMFK